MIVHFLRRASLALAALGCLIASPLASADVSKEACIDAHSRGQDAKEQGQISLARKLFLTCAQAACPALVQGDCARFVDDLGRLQPTLSFVARDAGGNDLPDTAVYIDDVLMATRLDDGKAYDVDPGKHTVKFSHAGKDQAVTVVVGAGEKGRTVSATFGAPAAPAGSAPAATVAPQPAPVTRRAPAPGPVHPTGAKVLLGVGSALAVGGGVLGLVGLVRVPGNCSIGTHECAAPPGDPAFDRAHNAVTLMNVGFLVAGVGTATVVGGFVWYMQGAKTPKEKNVVAPWFSPGAAGIAVAGPL
jgi:hypothetical protein